MNYLRQLFACWQTCR